uniref:Uncharacterized protein n=1 Tax=Arundo donax TaxID=35708 RepID=A0A0A9FSN6_ARUDO
MDHCRFSSSSHNIDSLHRLFSVSEMKNLLLLS